MYRISELISMKVISIYEGDSIGIIKNAYFDNKLKKCKYVQVLNEEKEYMEIIKCSDIYIIGNECVFIKNKNFVDLEINCQKELSTLSTLINKETYTLTGDFLGFCNDILLNEKFDIEKIFLNNKKDIDTKYISNIGQVILTSDSSINILKFKPKQTISTHKIYNSHPNNVVILNKPQTPKNENKIQKVITDYRFLIGRILEKDIYAINGEIIAKKDSIINKDLVNKASYYGKLIDISRYSTKK